MRRYSCLLLFHLIACETTVEVDVPRNPSQLTVNSLFNPDSVWQVELTQNRYILDNEPFASVPDAEVQVLQEGQTVAVLDYVGDAPFTGNSIYRAVDSRPKIGEDYTVQVQHPTLGDLTADNNVPEPQMLLQAQLDTLDTRQDGQVNNDDIAYAITISLDDPPEKNFYSLSLFIRWNWFFGFDDNEDGEFDTDEAGVIKVGVEQLTSGVLIQSNDPVVDNVFDRYRGELLFTDASFNGQQRELKLYMAFETNDAIFSDLFAEPIVLAENWYDRQGNIAGRPGDTYRLSRLYTVLRTTTEEYYQYHYTRDLQASVESNPFAQPVQVFDNIEGGLGVFAGYSQVEQEVTIK